MSATGRSPATETVLGLARDAGDAWHYLHKLSYTLGLLFWRDLELHHPGTSSLRLAPDAPLGLKGTGSPSGSGPFVGHKAPPSRQPCRGCTCALVSPA